MKEEDKWILEFDHISINGKKHWFRCVWSFDKKSPNDDKPAIDLIFNIYKEGHGWINWREFKGSYLAEKFTDYVKNTLNGQRSIYWDNKVERKFDD